MDDIAEYARVATMSILIGALPPRRTRLVCAWIFVDVTPALLSKPVVEASCSILVLAPTALADFAAGFVVHEQTTCPVSELIA